MISSERRDQAIVAFVTAQLFVLIYLQKFALFSGSFPLALPMLTMFVGIGWMLLRGHLQFAVFRTSAFLVFVAFCLVSFALVGGSLPSLLQLILLYGSMTVAATVPEAAFFRILRNFILMMVIPAIIIIEQYAFQKITGLSDPLNMDRLFPESILLQGFNYAGHFPWYSSFSRPQGFFFLEPSLASCFVASAAIIEITYFRRWHYVLLMIGATFLTQGATGVVMLVIAAPFLLARETPNVIALTLAGVLVAGTAAYALDIPLPVISRANELETGRSSGGERLTLPALRFAELLSDPSYIFSGDGAGSISGTAKPIKSAKDLQNAYNAQTAIMNPWPMVKLLNEYGLLAMMAFIVFFLTGTVGGYNVPLKVALSIMYGFSGGYLLNVTVVVMLAFLCFIVSPRNA